MVAAQSGGVRRGHQAGEVRILRVTLLIAPPSWVAELVHHRRPDVEAAPGRVLVVEAARLVADGHTHRADQIDVPGARQPDRLGEDRRPGRARPSPCSASVPVRNPASPRRGTGGWCWCSRAVFSSSPSLDNRSATRSRRGAAGSRNALGRARSPMSASCGLG